MINNDNLDDKVYFVLDCYIWRDSEIIKNNSQDIITSDKTDFYIHCHYVTFGYIVSTDYYNSNRCYIRIDNSCDIEFLKLLKHDENNNNNFMFHTQKYMNELFLTRDEAFSFIKLSLI